MILLPLKNSCRLRASSRANHTSRLSEQLIELLHREAGLSDDRAKRTRFEIATGVNGHRHGPRRVSREHHDVMAADDALGYKPRTRKRTYDAPAVDRRQLAGHVRRRPSRDGFQGMCRRE